MTDATKLFALAEADDAAALSRALDGVDVARIHNAGGESLFRFCLFHNHPKCAQMLKTRGGFALQDAALAGDAARIATLLKDASWTVDTLSPDGWTALHLASFFGNDAAVVALLDHDANARIMGRAFEQNLALHAACAGGRLGRAAFARLVKATGDPDALQKQGYTALMIAAGNGFVDAVEVLLEAGANRGLKQGEGKTAAELARERGHGELAKKLS